MSETARQRARQLMKPLFLRPCSPGERDVTDRVEAVIEGFAKEISRLSARVKELEETTCTEEEWRARDDLRKHWHAFCDADVLAIDRDDFTDRLEKFGLITWREVTKRDVEDTPFAYELGLEVGGMCFDLTAKGRALLNPPESDKEKS